MSGNCDCNSCCLSSLQELCTFGCIRRYNFGFQSSLALLLSINELQFHRGYQWLSLFNYSCWACSFCCCCLECFPTLPLLFFSFYKILCTHSLEVWWMTAWTLEYCWAWLCICSRLLCLSSLIAGNGGISVPAFDTTKALLVLATLINMCYKTREGAVWAYISSANTLLCCLDWKRSRELHLCERVVVPCIRLMNTKHWLPQGRPRFGEFHTTSFHDCVSPKNIPSTLLFLLLFSLFLSSPFPSPTLLSNFLCFHRNWVLSNVFFSYGSFLPRWRGFWKSITPSKQAAATLPAAYNI